LIIMTAYGLLFAFSGPILWAVSTHLDKYLVEEYFKQTHPAVLLIFTALTNLVGLLVIWILVPGVADAGAESIVLMGLAGVLLMGAMLFYLRALQSQEASVVAPFFQAAPLFGYGLGYAVLGEALSALQLVGAALIVSGTLAASVRTQRKTSPRLNGRLVLPMLACALAAAMSSLIFKVFALRDAFWTTTFWMFVGETIFGCAILAIGSLRGQFVAILKSNTAAVLGISAANELINLGGGLGTRYALVLAPLSLVQAIGGTTTVFVFMVGIALSLVWPALGREDLSARELARKGAAAILVACGVLLLTR
jgi:uncharacterized membrane protein